MSSRELLQSLKIRSLFFIQLISDLYSSLCSSSSSILSQYREESNKPNALSVFGDENSVEAWVRALVQPWIQSFGLSLDTIKTWREKRVQSCIHFQRVSPSGAQRRNPYHFEMTTPLTMHKTSTRRLLFCSSVLMWTTSATITSDYFLVILTHQEINVI